MLKLKYLKTLLAHKWFVFRGGLMVGKIPLWRLIVHDWSKFTPWEFGRYARSFCGNYGVSPVDRDAISADFAIAWLSHENKNPHHVGFWTPRTGQFHGIHLRMPDTFVREMVADLLGASRAYTGSWIMTDWLNDGNWDRLTSHMHVESVQYFNYVLEEIGYRIKWERTNWIEGPITGSGFDLEWVYDGKNN